MTDAVAFDDSARLAALHGLGLLDTPPEEGFDDIVRLARAITGADVALISLVDTDRQWFKARSGLDVQETPRSVAFCDYTIRQNDVLVTLDATQDPRFADNPLVTGDPHIRFYAAAPIRSPDRQAIGTVCVIDPRPRASFEGQDALKTLARQVESQIELRRLVRAGAAAQEAANRDRDRLWTLAHDLIIVCDLEGRVLAANPAWVELFGSLEAPGAVWMRQFLVDGAEKPDLYAIADGTAVPLTRDYRGHDGHERTISWTLRREGLLIYGIGRDDTALRAAERELVQSQKMESLGQLTGGIAHDFNNLLTIVIGNLDIALRKLDRDEPVRVRRAIGEAQEGAARAAVLTQRLLAFARRQRLAPRPADPAALLADMRTLIEQAASELIDVEILVEGGIWPVEIDVNQLENAIINLCLNARDAMSMPGLGGTLLISAANTPVSEKEAARHGVEAGDFVQIVVADTGIGMSDEVRARAFEPFFSTKGVGRGTGLGLSQVHGFVRQSGGFVTLDTRQGEGTSVHICLPRGRAVPENDGPMVSMPLAEVAPRIVTVMVVEDNDALRELVVETLRDEGYRVIEAHDGRSALTLFARQSPPPDMVVSDVMMPRLDGFSLAAEVRTRSPGTRVLLMSGYSGNDTPIGQTDEPILLKPFTPDALLDRVRALLDQPQDMPVPPAA